MNILRKNTQVSLISKALTFQAQSTFKQLSPSKSNHNHFFKSNHKQDP